MKGLFQSTDSGATWKAIGLSGERVTSINVWAWERYYPAVARYKTTACVTTCGDHWMEFLCRGRSVVKTRLQGSKSYLSPDGGQKIEQVDHRTDTGFYHSIFDKAAPSTREMRHATTHGIQAQVELNTHTALYPRAKHLEWFRPTTAIGAMGRVSRKFGRVISGPLQPLTPGRLSLSEQWASEWSWISPNEISGGENG